MSCDEDYLYALRLQNELNAEEEALVEVSTFLFLLKLCYIHTTQTHVKEKWF